MSAGNLHSANINKAMIKLPKLYIGKFMGGMDLKEWKNVMSTYLKA